MGAKYTAEDEKALRDFLLDEDCLEELLPWTERFNIFDVLKISRTEIRHSNQLSWLLDPNENHGLGDRYLKSLFQLIATNSAKHDVFDVLLMDYKSFIVLREWKNIDILLISKEEKVVVAIENKVGSHEHSNQLNRYRTILEKEYEEYKKIYLFLTPDGDVPSDPENWEAISYRELIDELERITANVELLPDAELMIKNYIEIIRRDIVEDQELVEICNKIYQKHKRAFELIYENKTDNRSVVVDSLLEPLKKYENEGKIKIDYKLIGNTVISFSTYRMDEFLPEDDKYVNSWGDHSLYRYYIYLRHYPDIFAKFELGGSNFNPIYADSVNKITQLYKPGDSRDVFKYKRLYSTKKYTVDEDNIDESCPKIIDSIVSELLKKEETMLIKCK